MRIAGGERAGSAGDLFQLANVAPNLDRYTRWLWQTHTPILALAAAAPFLVARRATAWLALALAAATMLVYLPYRVFDDWWYIRFLLPAIPFLIALSVAAVARIVGRADRAAVRVDGDDCHSWCVVGARRDRAPRVRSSRVGAAFHRRRPLRARQTAGECRRCHRETQRQRAHYYAQRPTVAWDTLDPDTLDRALDFLRDRGLVPMLMIDAEEEAAFRAKFAESSLIGRLDWPPVTRVGRTVRIYDPADRARYWRR